MRSKAKITIRLASKQTIEAIAKSLNPELIQASSKANVKLILARKYLRLSFHGRDSTALRAIVTSYLRMISASMRVIASIDELKK